MNFSVIGNFLKSNGSSLLGLAGSIVTGNIPGGIAAIASMVTEATGESEPSKALAVLQSNPEAMIKLEEIAKRDEADIRMHHREMLRLELEDKQAEHSTTQATIQSGDNATDEYVRRTRPKLARQSWYATMSYICVAELLSAFSKGDGASMELALVLIGPASVYIGMRTVDKWKQAGIKGLLGK